MKLSAVFVCFVLLSLCALLIGGLLALIYLCDYQRRKVLAVTKTLLNAFLLGGMVLLILLLALSTNKSRSASLVG